MRVLMTLIAVGFLVASAQAQELFVFPNEDQSQDQQDQDEFQCHRLARDRTGFDPMQTPTATRARPETQGGALRGAAGGALLGTAVGAITGDVRRGAAAGGVGGGLLGGMPETTAGVNKISGQMSRLPFTKATATPTTGLLLHAWKAAATRFAKGE